MSARYLYRLQPCQIVPCSHAPPDAPKDPAVRSAYAVGITSSDEILLTRHLHSYVRSLILPHTLYQRLEGLNPTNIVRYAAARPFLERQFALTTSGVTRGDLRISALPILGRGCKDSSPKSHSSLCTSVGHAAESHHRSSPEA